MTKTDHAATRLLALAALDAGAIDGVDFDFVDENPHRAHEVSEFNAWVNTPTAADPR